MLRLLGLGTTAFGARRDRARRCRVGLDFGIRHDGVCRQQRNGATVQCRLRECRLRERCRRVRLLGRPRLGRSDGTAVRSDTLKTGRGSLDRHFAHVRFGLLTLAAAARRPDLVRGLALLATPWDFHAADPDRARALAAALPLYEPALAFAEALPVDILQTMFAALDPFGIAAKYRGFARLDQASPSRTPRATIGAPM